MTTNRDKLLIEFKPGDIIFEEGAQGNKLFVLQSGTVDICCCRDAVDVQLATLQTSGTIFGEMSLIDGQPRSATARAVTEVTCLSVGRAMFRQKMQTETPTWVQSMLHVVIDRLRMANLRTRARPDQIPGWQIVELLGILLRRGDSIQSGNVSLPLNEAIKEITYILELPQKYVMHVFDHLAESQIAAYDEPESGTKHFVIPEMGAFTQFSEFCMDSFMQERRGPRSDEAVKGKDSYIEVLELVVGHPSATGDEYTIGHEALFELQHQNMNEYDTAIDILVNQGLFEIGLEAPEGKTYLIKLGACREKIKAHQLQSIYEQLLVDITSERDPAPPAEES